MRLKFIRRDRGSFSEVCCLFFRFPVRNALRASEAVRATGVMVNRFIAEV